MEFTALVGVLGGSLGTLLVKEVLNQWNKKQDFSREMVKLTYEKKLAKAEDAVAYHYSMLSKVQEMKKSMELFKSTLNSLQAGEGGGDILVLFDLIQKAGAAIETLSQEKSYTMSGIYLYFDLEDEADWTEAELGDFLVALSETKALDNQLKAMSDRAEALESAGKLEEAQKAIREAVDFFPVYTQSLQRVIDGLEANQRSLEKVIFKIKTQLKKSW